MKIKSFVYIVAAVGLILGMTFLIHERSASSGTHLKLEKGLRKVSVQVIKPIIQDLDIKLRYPVNIQAVYQANILPTAVSGFLMQVDVDKGDFVKKGQLLATINPSEEAENVKHEIGRAHV